MSIAKKSLMTILTIICLIVAGSFLAARISQRRNLPLAKKPKPHETITTKPFFYTNVGSSDPESSITRSSQKLSKFTVNIQTFASKGEAETLVTRLSSVGLSAYYTPVRQAGRVLYHVRIGIFSDEQEASRALATIQKKTSLQGSVGELQ